MSPHYQSSPKIQSRVSLHPPSRNSSTKSGRQQTRPKSRRRAACCLVTGDKQLTFTSFLDKPGQTINAATTMRPNFTEETKDELKGVGSIRRIRRRPHPYPFLLSPPHSSVTAVRGRLRGSSGTRSGLWPSVVHRLDCSLILFPSFSVASISLLSSPMNRTSIEGSS